MATRNRRNPTREENVTSREIPAAENSSRPDAGTTKAASGGNTDTTIDVAIVGGGIAGLYAAWRLKADQIIASDDKSTDSLPKREPNPEIRVSIFESSYRIGGRLYSVNIPGVAIRAELGAMRYMSRHRLLTGLIFNFFGNFYPKAFDFSATTSFYVRGRRLRSDDLRNNTCNHCAAPIPFSLKECEKGKLPEDLIQDAIWNMLSELNFADSTLKHTDVARIRGEIRRHKVEKKSWSTIHEHGRFKDTHLYDIGFWNLLQHFLSNEAFLLAHDCLGYESIIGNWNAAEALEWFVNDFEPQAQLMLPQGFETLVEKMEKDLTEPKSRVSIETQHRLCKLERIGDGNKSVWKLTFKVKKDGKRSEVSILAKHVILALPMRALKSIVVTDKTKKPVENIERQSGKVSKSFWEKFKPNLDAVRPHRLFKFFLVYPRPWWLGLTLPGKDYGRVFTDLPIRQVYYFGPEWIKSHATQANIEEALEILKKREEGGEEKNELSLVMASYSDAHYVNFWRPFSRKRRAGDEQDEYDDDVRDDDVKDKDGGDYDIRYYRCRRDVYRALSEIHDRKLRKATKKNFETVKNRAATERMVMKVQQQLAELHGVPIEFIPDPIASIFMDWGGGEYGEGGWHTWEVHEEPWNFTKNHLEGLFTENLYICGEAYSREQGWIEGALKSTEQVLLKLRKRSLDSTGAKTIDIFQPVWFPNEDDFYEYIDFSQEKKSEQKTPQDGDGEKKAD
jgi:hypothetical protein